MSNINYTRDWKFDISELSEEEWGTLISILVGLGVEIYSTEYEDHWTYLAVGPNRAINLSRWRDCSDVLHLEEVSLLGMIRRLKRPLKTSQQLKIEELKETIENASKQIEALEKES